MKDISFKSRINKMAIVSLVGCMFLFLAILGVILRNNYIFIGSLIVYIGAKVIGNIIWRCPNCKAKLPKGQHPNTMKKCSHCDCDLC
ncbi:hypothetical protein HF520_08385 [Romboutsia sp. CE17]|uniref:hypothetical protein n=1 Tax=Romboutsia sp. CE17 TaxID=2724150 RepID=UPI001442E25F|nr:hypothetical protein [Romboutsia sp. CE17]QJA08965.1 hypothetical protein HF520_08385 [Romboutsia sp. CE17]